MWSVCVCVMTLGGPWADSVIDHIPGAGGVAGYDDPTTVLGPPSSMSGAGTPDESVVSPFSPAWQTDQLLSLGAGGRVTVRFDQPVVDDPENAYGIDLIVFGNAGLIDGNWPQGACVGLFGADGGRIRVSADGQAWHTVEDVAADALWPTMAFLDAGPYDILPGASPTDPTRPVDPQHTLDDALGATWADLVSLYDGSAGGTGIDLAWVGLDAIQYVRIEVDQTSFLSPEIDAIVDAGLWVSGDVTGDGVVGVDDVLAVIAAWGSADPTSDVDHDGIVGVNDLLVVLEQWS